MVSAGIVRAARAAAAGGFDALAIGCFYDTALLEAREVSGDMVVTAPCAAALEIAASLANRFGIIVGRQKWVHQMHATVRDNGMAERLSGFYPVELGVTDFQTDHVAFPLLSITPSICRLDITSKGARAGDGFDHATRQSVSISCHRREPVNRTAGNCRARRSSAR